MRRAALAGILAVLALCGCGGGDSGSGDASDDAAARLPSKIQAAVRGAQDPRASEFPDPAGKSLQQLADQIGGGPQMGMASSVFVAGRKNRVAFGMIDKDAGFLYGKTALYIAPKPGAPARGPFVAPADILLTKPAYRSQQAATEGDPFAAVYAAQVPLPRAGDYSLLAVTLVNGKPVAAPQAIKVIAASQDRIPAVGQQAPKVPTDTVASAGGDVQAIDTRRPTSDMHQKSFADVVGKRPVALLFATPQLCQSRVCGPVVDIALQLKARYGDRMDFIHQEVYVDNDVNKGLRPPLKAFHLPTEPWLFVVDKNGRITARLEGSFGLRAFDQALNTAL
jgi:hypothetical protein